MLRKERISTRLQPPKQTSYRLEKMSPMSIPVRHSKSRSMPRWHSGAGLSMNGHKRFGFIEGCFTQ